MNLHPITTAGAGFLAGVALTGVLMLAGDEPEPPVHHNVPCMEDEVAVTHLNGRDVVCVHHEGDGARVIVR